MTNIQEILKSSSDRLKRAKITNPYLEAEILLSFCLTKAREYILAHSDELLTQDKIDIYNHLISKRLEGYSIAAITGKKSFYGYEFKVNDKVLIPRPETETMVDEILNVLKKSNEDFLYIDIGTGSACIPISVANELKKSEQLERVQIRASDISDEALEIAKSNLLNHNLQDKIKLVKGNLLDPFKSEIKNHKSKIIISANLPYLTKEQIQNSPSIQKEPVLALDGGKDGMDLYIELFKQIKKLKLTSSVVYCEIDHGQVDTFYEEINSIIPGTELKTIKDLASYDRIIEVLIN